MSECEYTAKLSACHDGELSADERANIESHIERCDACRDELSRMVKLSTMLGSLPHAEISPAAMRRMHHSAGSLGGLGIRRFAEELAAVAALILVACTIWMVSQSSATAAPATIPLWQTAAVSQPSADSSSASSEELLANWVVADLSVKEQHD